MFSSQPTPNMAATHRPDFHALTRETIDVRRRNASRLRNDYLLPFINLEDLLKANNLLFISQFTRSQQTRCFRLL